MTKQPPRVPVRTQIESPHTPDPRPDPDPWSVPRQRAVSEIRGVLAGLQRALLEAGVRRAAARAGDQEFSVNPRVYHHLWVTWRRDLPGIAPPPETTITDRAQAQATIDAFNRRLEGLFGPNVPAEPSVPKAESSGEHGGGEHAGQRELSGSDNHLASRLRKREIVMTGGDAAETKRTDSVMAIAEDQTLTVDRRMQIIYRVDNRVVGWTSPRWAELLQCTEQAVRKTHWWKVDRKKLRGTDRRISGAVAFVTSFRPGSPWNRAFSVYAVHFPLRLWLRSAVRVRGPPTHHPPRGSSCPTPPLPR